MGERRDDLVETPLNLRNQERRLLTEPPLRVLPDPRFLAESERALTGSENTLAGMILQMESTFHEQIHQMGSTLHQNSLTRTSEEIVLTNDEQNRSTSVESQREIREDSSGLGHFRDEFVIRRGRNASERIRKRINFSCPYCSTTGRNRIRKMTLRKDRAKICQQCAKPQTVIDYDENQVWIPLFLTENSWIKQSVEYIVQNSNIIHTPEDLLWTSRLCGCDLCSYRADPFVRMQFMCEMHKNFSASCINCARRQMRFFSEMVKVLRQGQASFRYSAFPRIAERYIYGNVVLVSLMPTYLLYLATNLLGKRLVNCGASAKSHDQDEDPEDGSNDPGLLASCKSEKSLHLLDGLEDSQQVRPYEGMCATLIQRDTSLVRSIRAISLFGYDSPHPPCMVSAPYTSRTHPPCLVSEPSGFHLCMVPPSFSILKRSPLYRRYFSFHPGIAPPVKSENSINTQ